MESARIDLYPVNNCSLFGIDGPGQKEISSGHGPAQRGDSRWFL